MKHTLHNKITIPEVVMHEYGLQCQNTLSSPSPVTERSRSMERGLGPALPAGRGEDYNALGLAHKQFLNLNREPLKKETAIGYDVKGVLENVDRKYK